MVRGRKPKPTALKKLGGNAGKRKINKKEPQPPAPADLMTPAPWLDELAQAEWRRIAPTLSQLGLLTIVDRAALEGYCKAYSRWREAEKTLEEDGLTFKTPQGYVQQRPEVSIAKSYLAHMHSLAAEFGFTPASRSRVTSKSPDGDGDDFEKFMQDRKGAAPGQGAGNAPSRSLH